MTQQVPVVTDPCLVLARVCVLLAEGGALPAALDLLCAGLGLRTAVVRSATGDLLAVGGEVLNAVPHMRALPGRDPELELPVPGRSGSAAATLTVVGARPSQLVVLRAAAGVLGLALAPVGTAEDLVAAAELDRDELADSLHDGPVQSLVVARYAADAAVRGGDPVAARDAVQEALVEVRRLLWHLRPRGGAGLQEALEQLSHQLVEAGAPPVTLVGDLGAVAALGATRAAAAYRLVQAVCRPDGATVTGRREDAVLLLDIEGAAPLPSPERWALRVRGLGGDLSSRGGGLRLALPLPSQHEPRAHHSDPGHADPSHADPSHTDARTAP